MIDAASKELLVSKEGLKYLHFLREAFILQDRIGTVDACLEGAAADLVSDAKSLGWVKQMARRWCLTPLGYKLGNTGKEYCNWLDEGRPLLAGATPELVAGKRVLDVGCGSGRLLLGIQRHGAHGVGVDLEEYFLELVPTLAAMEGVPAPRLIRARAERLPFSDCSFDVVYCRLVLTYVLDVQGCMREFARVLVPGGRIVLQYPTMRDGLSILKGTRWCGNWRHTGWLAFGILNAAFMELTGKQWHVSLKGRMHEKHSPTYPRASWIRRALARCGFDLLPPAETASSLGCFHAVRRP